MRTCNVKLGTACAWKTKRIFVAAAAAAAVNARSAQPSITATSQPQRLVSLCVRKRRLSFTVHRSVAGEAGSSTRERSGVVYTKPSPSALGCVDSVAAHLVRTEGLRVAPRGHNPRPQKHRPVNVFALPREGSVASAPIQGGTAADRSEHSTSTTRVGFSCCATDVSPSDIVRCWRRVRGENAKPLGPLMQQLGVTWAASQAGSGEQAIHFCLLVMRERRRRIRND